jgi:predicted nucleotidyltransferase
VNGLIPFRLIRRLANQIVEKFQPEKIILFGSYADGEPNVHSDVDLLVVMPAKNEITQAGRIRLATEHPFPLDLLVRTPVWLSARLERGDSFIREVVGRGRVLYEKTDRGVDSEGRSRPSLGAQPRRRKTASK